MMEYVFYMQSVDRSGTVGIVKNLESDFAHLRYRSCEGLESIGAPKNIYTEEYPEANGPRLFHPSDIGESVTHKATTVKLNVVFIGGDDDSHRDSYRAFSDFLHSGRVYYWDTARHKKVLLVLNSETSPTADTVKGQRYMTVTFTFTNIWGKAVKCNDDGTVSTTSSSTGGVEIEGPSVDEEIGLID